MTPNKESRWQTFRKIIEMLASLSIAISLPLGFYQMRQDNIKEREHLIEKTYDELDQRYVDFQKLILQYPHLDCFDEPSKNPGALTDEERTKQKVLYSIVLSILERAYIMYNQQGAKSDGRKHQWKGWDLYAGSFIKRPAFREAWKEIGIGYDDTFQKYMNQKIKS